MTTRPVRKRPVVVECMEYDGENRDTVIAWVDDNEGATCYDQNGLHVYNPPDDQWLTIPVGHYVIRGVRGEFYPCHPEILRATYDDVEDVSDVEIANRLLVGSGPGPDQYAVLAPKPGMSRDEALVLAAWLVVLADPLGARFPGILERVEHI